MTDPAPHATPRRARHLLDPDNPRPARPSSRAMSTERVQMWVASALVVTTLGHLAAGIVVAAFYLDSSRTGARVTLLVIAGIFGVIAVAVARAIHRRPLLSGWLVVGWLPTAIGCYLLFAR